ncbi:MAG: GNAT family N-acetyltransferase [Lachnospiraceae bacterium]|nr:GNAT family N-acetyltransferase [Lachnospiraceae bacterium]
MKYRNLSKTEAEKFWELMNQLDYETKYMLYEPGERTKNLSRIESLIQNSVEGEDFLLVAEADDRIVGYISAQKGGLNRIAHSAYIVVGILKDYRGKGIGTDFFNRLDIWAEEKHVKRLELTVVCENEVAKHLYEKSGFEIEGIKRKSVLVNGEYLDEYYMAKIK